MSAALLLGWAAISLALLLWGFWAARADIARGDIDGTEAGLFILVALCWPPLLAYGIFMTPIVGAITGACWLTKKAAFALNTRWPQ